MNIKQRLKNRPAFYQLILSLLNSINYFNWRFNYSFPHYTLSDTWRKRIDLVRQSEDNLKIEHIPNAGEIFRDHQVMHNGLKIALGSYYDYGNTILLRENKGVHEPQEEYVFQEVLKSMPAGACMMELGSYWAFYSMWFARQVNESTCFMVEPDPHKMNFGKLNFKLNNLKGIFNLGFIDGENRLGESIPTFTVDYLIKKHGIDFLHMLHSDIQGYEYAMLHGAQEAIKNNKIGYIFISTHSNQLHEQCKAFLVEHNFDIICSANLDETYSWDGLIVARNNLFTGLQHIEISKKNTAIKH
jgi:hypothetical protein